MLVFNHDEFYFEKTPIEKQRVCCNCRHRVPNASMADKCNIDGHRIGYLQCFSNWCRHWALYDLERGDGEV